MITLGDAARLLRESGIPANEAITEARLIFNKYSGLAQTETLMHGASSDAPELYDAIERRKKREPLQYILGEVWFYNECYKVTPDCLIPRSDTEILVEETVALLPSGARFLDLCTGSGCVAISVLANSKDTVAVAADISDAALGIAKTNAIKNGVSDRLTLMHLDVKKERAEGEFFAVVSNPPYVTDSAYGKLEPEIYHEPKIAFLGGEDGMDFYRAIMEAYRDALPEDGFFAFEIGYDQAEAIKKIAFEHSMNVRIRKDYSGCDRVAVIGKAR